MLERAFSTLFWLLYGKECSHVPTKVIEPEFTDENTECWRGVTPHTPASYVPPSLA